MIKFNFERLFKAKGIDKPFTFLVNAGFSDNFATKVKNNKVKQIGLEQLEKFCIALNCAPNDLFNWVPDKDQQLPADHPLQSIRRTGKAVDLRNAFHSMKMEDLEDIEKYIKEKKKAQEKKP